MATDTMPLEGMPTHEGDLSIEAHGMDPIPESARYGSVGRVFTVWFTPNLVPAAFFIGTLVTLDFLKLGFVTSVLAIIVGNVVGSAFVGLLSTMGPKTGMAQLPVARLPFGKSIVLPGLLNWFSTIGWDGINSLFGALAITLIIPAIPFWLALVVIVLCQGTLGIFGYEAIHLFEKWAAVVLGIMFVILTIAILGKADTSLTDGFSGLDQIGAFIAYVAIVASFVLAWSLYASDYSRYLPSDSSPSKVFWYTLLGMSLASGWLEILGLLVAGQATGGESSDTIFQVLGGSGNIIAILAMVAIAVGTVAVNAMNDYTGSLSLQAAGFRIKRVYSAVVVAVLGFLFTLYLNAQTDFAGSFTNFLLFISYWICAVRRRGPGRLVAAKAACRRQPPQRLRRAADGGRRDRGADHRLPGRDPVPELVARLRLGRPVQLRHRELPPRRGHRLLRGRDRGRGHLHHVRADARCAGRGLNGAPPTVHRRLPPRPPAGAARVLRAVLRCSAQRSRRRSSRQSERPASQTPDIGPNLGRLTAQRVQTSDANRPSERPAFSRPTSAQPPRRDRRTLDAPGRRTLEAPDANPGRRAGGGRRARARATPCARRSPRRSRSTARRWPWPAR